MFLFGMWAPEADRTKRVSADWYRDFTLMFSFTEMRELMANCFAVNGNLDPMFGFGFDNENKIVQTRGDKHRKYLDFTEFSLTNRISKIKQNLDSDRW